jgi:hypothetical protein
MSSGAQTTVDVGVPQAPLWHDSPDVHALASSQGVPSRTFGFEQRPVAKSQVPAV